MVWDPGNDTPVPVYLQQCGYTQCSRLSHSHFVHSQPLELADWVVLNRDDAPLCILHSVIPTLHIQHHVADLLLSDSTCVWLITLCRDLYEISAQYQQMLVLGD